MTRRIVLANSAWLIADKVVRLGLGMAVWIWFARRFGPEAFGIWNYAMAFATLFSVFGGLGMDGVIVRELVAPKADRGAILGTALAMRIAASLLAAAGAAGTAAWLREGEGLVILLVGLNALVFVLQSSQVIDYHFQAHMRARPAVVAANLAFLVTTLGRLAMLALGAPIEWFGVSLVVEAILAAGLLYRAYAADDTTDERWRIDLRVARHLLAESWPLLLSGLAVMAYMRLDQVMLATLVDDEAVGQFSAALRIAEVWYFIPMAIMAAAFPAMLSKRDEGARVYEHYVQRLYDAMAWLGVGVAAVATLAAHHVVPLLYGARYDEAATILTVQIWAGVAVSMSFVHGKWLLAEGLQRYGLFYTVAGAVVNVSLNLILIPRLGAVGAAWATLATQVGLLPIQLVFPRTRRNFTLMMKATSAPWRLLRTTRPLGGT